MGIDLVWVEEGRTDLSEEGRIDLGEEGGMEWKLYNSISSYYYYYYYYY
jgi:hypothetical protein